MLLPRYAISGTDSAYGATRSEELRVLRDMFPTCAVAGQLAASQIKHNTLSPSTLCARLHLISQRVFPRVDGCTVLRAH
eukprot:834975-Rhodomonas_salina.1